MPLSKVLSWPKAHKARFLELITLTLVGQGWARCPFLELEQDWTHQRIRVESIGGQFPKEKS